MSRIDEIRARYQWREMMLEMDTYGQEAHDDMGALLDALAMAEQVVDLARQSYDVIEYPAEESRLYKAIAAYDATKDQP